MCGNEGSLLQASHKDKGLIMVCRDCWQMLYENNETVSGTTSDTSASAAPSCSGSCAGCGI